MHNLLPLRNCLRPSRLIIVALTLLIAFGYLLNPHQVSAAPQTVSCSITPDQCEINPINHGDSASFGVSVSGFVQETALELKGFAPPGSFVLAEDGGQVIGAATAQADGTFDFLIHALQAGSTHGINVYAASLDQVTPGVAFVVTVTANSVTTIENILLPTFINVSPSAQNAGDPIHATGDTVPGGLVTLFMQPPLQSTQVTADGTGHWDVELLNAFGVLSEGSYSAYATVNYGAYISPNSRVVPFEVKPVPSTTKLVVNGYGPPGAFLSFKDGTQVVGSGLVASNGTFSQAIDYPDADKAVDLSIVADDGGQVTPPTAITTSVTAFTTTTVDDVLLPTFIDVSPVNSEYGDPIIVSGQGAPTADLELVIANPPQTINLTIDATGDWSQDIIASLGALPVGSYTAKAKLTMDGGLESVDSREVTFQIIQPTTSTSLTVSGFAAPNAFITFTENNAVVGTTVTQADGTFSVGLQFPDVTLPRTISLVADNGSQQTPKTTFTATVTANTDTQVANIVLPTFIDINPLKVPFGTTVLALGTTVPNAVVRLFVQSPLVSTDIAADSTDGKWSADLNQAFGQLEKGTYTAYARVYVSGSYQSNLSREITFEVIDADECAERRSDMNCDGQVDITDVGILIYYWGEAGNGQKADINKDGIVDVSDVGIMVYDWTY